MGFFFSLPFGEEAFWKLEEKNNIVMGAHFGSNVCFLYPVCALLTCIFEKGQTKNAQQDRISVEQGSLSTLDDSSRKLLWTELKPLMWY